MSPAARAALAATLPRATAPTLVAAACVLVVAAYWAAVAAGLLAGATRVAIGDLLSIPLGLTATVLAARSARRAPSPAVRAAWKRLAMGFALFNLADVAWFTYNVVLGWSPSLTWIDLLYLAYYPTVLWGLLSFPGAPRSRGARTRLALDVATVMLAGGLVVWHVLLRPLAFAPGITPLGRTLAAAYPLADLLLLTGAVTMLLRPSPQVGRPVLALVAAAPIFNVAANVGYGIYSLQGGYRGGRWPDLAWMLAWVSTVVAVAWQQRHDREGGVERAPTSRALLPYARLLPYAALVLAYGLVVVVTVRAWTPELGSLVVGALLLSVVVVTRQAIADAQRQLVQTRFRSLVRHSSDAIIVLGDDLSVRYASPATERMFGFTPGELRGRRPRDFIHPEDLDGARARLAEAVAKAEPSLAIACRLRRSDGSWCHVESVVTNRLDDPAVRGLVMNTRDVSERTALEASLAYQAFHDPLTGLANRARLRERVEWALAGAGDDPARVALLFLDLDDFKRVNDSLGHAEGDRLLVSVAERLLNATRGCDTVARMGGDEFAVLMENVRQDTDVAVVAERVLVAMQSPVQLDGAEVTVGVSVGTARARRGDTADALLHHADTAMYIAKRSGKNHYRAFEPEMQLAAATQLELETELRAAVEREELSLAFQPIVHLGGGVMAVEALARWPHPVRGSVPPSTFIPLAEATGLILPLGRWVLREACREAAGWRGPEAPAVSVNVSGVQLLDPDLPEQIRVTLAESGLPPYRLILEVTESVALAGEGEALQALVALRESGIRIAIDDFGAGHSSLIHLRRFRVDALKIDRELLCSGKGGDDSALLQAVLDMARALGLPAVVEGVELDSQHDELTRLGCRLAQGFLYSRPMPASELARFLEEVEPRAELVG